MNLQNRWKVEREMQNISSNVRNKSIKNMKKVDPNYDPSHVNHDIFYKYDADRLLKRKIF